MPDTEIAPALLEKFAIAVAGGAVDHYAYANATAQSYASPTDAFAHYLAAGGGAAPELFPFLDPDYYAQQLGERLPPDVTLFEHYVSCGAARDISPTPLFDPSYVRQSLAFNDIFDYLSSPESASVDPHILFSRQYYYLINADVAQAAVDPYRHYVLYGWRERRAIHPFFRVPEYVRFGFPADCDRHDFNRHLAAAVEHPDLASQQPLFDVAHYRRSLADPDTVAAPLQHYLREGWRQNLSPFPLFDAEFYCAQAGCEPGVGRNPYIGYLSDGSHRFSPIRYFDSEFYLSAVPDSADFKGSLLEHFIRFGAASRVPPARGVTVASPSRYSGLNPVASFCDGSGQRRWLCEFDRDGDLQRCLDDLREIDPGLPSDLLASCRLHANSGPVDQSGRALIAVATKIARCNCLTVSEAPLDDRLVRMLSSAEPQLVSSARPWLTLLSAAPPLVRYWHSANGGKDRLDFAAPAQFDGITDFVGKAVIAALPEKLVIKTDRLGIALLRVRARQIFSAIRHVALLLDFDGLPAADRQCLLEFLSIRYDEPRLLICANRRSAGITREAGLDLAEDAPPILLLEE